MDTGSLKKFAQAARRSLLEQTAVKLGPFKVILGAVCLGLAVWSLVL